MDKYIEIDGKRIKVTQCPVRFAGGWGDIEELPANVDFSKHNKRSKSGFIRDDKHNI